MGKDLSTLDVYKVTSHVSSQTKQVKKLHMPIKHVHKSLASVNEKTFFYISFFSTTTQKNKNNPFLCQLC